MHSIIKIENLSKIYRLGQISTRTINHDFKRWLFRMRGKEDPYLKIGETNVHSSKGNSDYVWAVKDINLEVMPGEVLGIIGKNGAGKSTLLKILSKVTGPTTGKIHYNGRIGSLLEVGTGFHQELSGRENIFLNGAILGMTKAEIRKKLDEIIDFSGCKRYIDTPVKRYSSGMMVRLGFSVAAHLDPEILVVDEVLAVGDAEFQKKAIGKMKEVTKDEGRTILFVSHNMGAVKELCNTAVLLNNGEISNIGTANNIVREYLSKPIKVTTPTDFLNNYESRRGNGEVRFTQIEINNDHVPIDPTSEIKILCRATVINSVDNVYFYMRIKDPLNGKAITETRNICLYNETLNTGTDFAFELNIPPNTFRTGIFPLYFWLGKNIELYDYPFDVVDGVYSLNLDTDKRKEELGYNSAQPNGLFNLKYEISNLSLLH